MKIIPIASPDEWHAIRQKHVGGSEVAALFGQSPYMTKFQLWHIKKGNLPAEDLTDNERVMAGNYMEPAIAAWAGDKWGVKLRKFHGYAVNPLVQGMGCTPDYINDDASLNVQIKNVDGLQFSREWTAEGEEIIEAPLHILLQVQHELAVTGAKSAWLVACVGGNRLLRKLIEPHDGAIKKIEAAVAAFWASIAENQEPKPVFEQDGDTIAAIRLVSPERKTIDLSANNRAHEVAAQWLRGNAMAKEGEAMAKAAKAEMLTMMGDATDATIGDVTVKTTPVKASKGTLVTEKMIGLYVGARAGYNRVSITTKEEGK